MSTNRWIGIGRLTRDPELRYTASGTAVCTFTLAIDRQFKNAQGEKEADFISLVAWRQLAELVANYTKKGSQVAIDGRIQTRSYDNSEGKRVYVTEVVVENVQFLSPSNSEDRKQQHGSKLDDPFAGDSKTVDIKDDDLPF